MRLGAEFPWTPSRTTDSNLDCVFVENTLFFVSKIWEPLAPLGYTTLALWYGGEQKGIKCHARPRVFS